MTRHAIGLVCVLLGALWAFGQVPATAPQGPGPATSEPASQPSSSPAPSEAIMKILNNLEAAGDRYTTVEANVVYRVDQKLTGDSEERVGLVAYQRKNEKDKTPPRVYIRFDTLKQGEGSRIEDKVEYAFDGKWVTEAKHRIQTMTKYQVAAEGEEIDPLKLGKSPCPPLPFGQKADDILHYFEPATREPIASDPKGTTYLRLTTKKEFEGDFNFVRLDMWIDPATNLPIKMISTEKNKNVTTVAFDALKTNTNVDPKIFTIDRKAGWTYHVESLKRDK